MREAIIALVIFFCLLAAAFGTLEAYARLPGKYREDDTFNVVRLVATIFVMMSSLVLGLMVNSSRNAFEAIDRDLKGFASGLILLDKTLVDYGPEAEAARQSLVAYTKQALEGSWPSESPSAELDRSAEQTLNDVGRKLREIRPPDNEHMAVWQDARQQYRKLVEQRWTLVGETESGRPGEPFIVMVALWLILIFASLGLRAPRNGVVVSAFVLAAALISGVLYLILDMERPFSGPIRISPAPLERALQEMQS
ncbi:DUF4239 domain-containing protein [Taklimakanibacter lacteus]|uniref:bestrophin-like domain n=1 Tax=Taklimakanibacter lacteus TaxID=2268456 RepID=UPI000E664C58